MSTDIMLTVVPTLRNINRAVINILSVVAIVAWCAVLVLATGCRSNDTGRNTVNVYGGGISQDGTAKAGANADTKGAINVVIVTGPATQSADKPVGISPALSAAASQTGSASSGPATASTPVAAPSSNVAPVVSVPAVTPSSNVTPSK